MNSFSTKLAQVERRFLLTIIALVVGAVVALGFFLYETNTIRFGANATSEELQSLTADNQAVADYLEQEKASEAHFITLANLIKQDQQNQLGDVLLVATGVTLVVAIAAGWLVARFLIKPVRAAYASQERFLQDAAHELRNPLAAMTAALQNEPTTKQGQADLIKTMNRQTKRLIRINEDLLFLERQQTKPKIEEINLSDLVSDILEDLQPVIAAKKLKLVNEIEEGITKKMDPNDLIKLARNTLENAVKYTPKSGTITVQLMHDKRHSVLFAVHDTGIGIPADDLANIGERFFRASNAVKHDGTGLGIAIVQKVVNTYGGNLSIDSTEGQGTTVSITL